MHLPDYQTHIHQTEHPNSYQQSTTELTHNKHTTKYFTGFFAFDNVTNAMSLLHSLLRLLKPSKLSPTAATKVLSASSHLSLLKEC